MINININGSNVSVSIVADNDNSINKIVIPSFTNSQVRYVVTNDNGVLSCSCPDFQIRGRVCKHIKALKDSILKDKTFVVSSMTTKKAKYVVKVINGVWSCSCVDNQLKGGTCKHIKAIQSGSYPVGKVYEY